jgi:hypothetical protein
MMKRKSIRNKHRMVTKHKLRKLWLKKKNQRNGYLGCTNENIIFCEEYAAGVSVRCELVPEHKAALTKEIVRKRVCRHEPSHQKMKMNIF